MLFDARSALQQPDPYAVLGIGGGREGPICRQWLSIVKAGPLTELLGTEKFNAFLWSAKLASRDPMNTHDSPIFALEEPSPHAVEVPVLKVFDGDGFLTRIRAPDGTPQVEAAVRFGFIDAPEMEQPGGAEAREFLTRLIGGRSVWIDILIKMNTGECFDRYGRIVAVPYVKQEYRGSRALTSSRRRPRTKSFRRSLFVARNIELEMVLNGWAWVLDRYGPDDRYFEALEDARANKRGIWARENNIHPWTFKQQKGFDQRRKKLPPRLAENCPCPEKGCGGKLIKRKGRFGEFIGCSNFPKCRYSNSASI